MKNSVLKIVAAALVCSIAFLGCKKKDNGYGSIAVRMTDSPGDYKQVNVEISQMQAHYDNGNWMNLTINSGVYDLLTLQNNITVVLASGSHVPAGKITQLRMILGTHNTVMLNDSTIHSLKIPSSWNTGIKVNVDALIPNSSTLTIVLDYDADASINLDGNGQYNMNPVVKVKSVY